MMKRVLIYGVLFWVLGCYKAAGQEAIGLYDLHYTLETDLSTPKGRNVAWDDVHVVSALQGIVNRDAPQLYVFFVDRDQLDIDKYWLNKYRRKGQWLYRKETVTYNTIEDLVSAYAGYIKGVVLYDERVPSTSNVASAVAGAEDLLPIRYDLDSESLYSRLVLGGPRLKVKRRLINEDGSVMFTGSGVIPGTNRNSTGSIKNDPYIWYIENYMKTGKCNTEYAAYYLDQYWKQNPGATVRNHHTLSNHDFFISKRAFFFDLSPWGDEPATDEPIQKVGTDLATLKEMLLLAYQQNKGEKYCYIGGFPSWAFKYTKHAGGIHDDVPTEWEFLRLISAYNAFKDADAIAIGALANASFWQHFPLEERYSQPWVTHEELKQRGLLTEDGKVDVKGRNFLIFYVGDYDASSWVSQFTSLTWDDPNRGKVPMMWAISPVLQERVPHVLHNFRKTATKNDYFVASDNGAGYLSPGMLQEPRPISGLPSGLQSWDAERRGTGDMKLSKASNLADVEDKDKARHNINVYSIEEVDALLAGKLDNDAAYQGAVFTTEHKAKLEAIRTGTFAGRDESGGQQNQSEGYVTTSSVVRELSKYAPRLMAGYNTQDIPNCLLQN